MPQNDQLGHELINSKLITPEQLGKVEEYQKSLGGTIAEVVVKLGFVSDQKLVTFLAERYQLPIADLDSIVLPISLVKRVPWQLIKTHNIVPTELHNRTITIATANPSDYMLIEELQYATGLQVEYNVASAIQIKRAIKELQSQVAEHSEPKLKTPKPKSAGKLRPASQASIDVLRNSSEQDLVSELHMRGEGKISSTNLSKGELREALIPALLKKGVISKQELFDAVGEILVKKGVIDARDLSRYKG